MSYAELAALHHGVRHRYAGTAFSFGTSATSMTITAPDRNCTAISGSR